MPSLERWIGGGERLRTRPKRSGEKVTGRKVRAWGDTDRKTHLFFTPREYYKFVVYELIADVQYVYNPTHGAIISTHNHQIPMSHEGSSPMVILHV